MAAPQVVVEAAEAADRDLVVVLVVVVLAAVVLVAEARHPEAPRIVAVSQIHSGMFILTLCPYHIHISDKTPAPLAI